MEGPILSTKLVVFEGEKIRKVFRDGEWWFSVVDVVGALTDSADPKDYWYRMKVRVESEDGLQLSTICRQLKLQAPDGKMRETDCANTEDLFRIIQSIPSPKAEPFKLWLAKVGYERVQEIEDPELAQKRMRALYKAKGYSDSWIEKRIRGIAIREELTDEWRERGTEKKKDFGILTAEIAKATFGLTPSEHKELKGLERQNLRDHMSNMELVLTMLGEAATTEIHQAEDSQGVEKLQADAKTGGEIAGATRKNLEKKLGRQIVTKKNFLNSKNKDLLV